MWPWLTRQSGWVGRQFGDVWQAVVAPDREPQAAAEVAARARGDAPVVWLLGKVQSGKSSIVRVLTGSADAEIGLGFKACTRTARVFDFPEEAPVIRFLDTRGLGEVGYDPAEDIAVCEGRSQLILVVVKAMDHNQGAVLDVLRTARQRHPKWPVLVAQTTLHDGYPPGSKHVLPYPFATGDARAASANVPALADLSRSLQRQRALFEELPGNGPVVFVPLDFTRDGDGFEPQTYGIDALLQALREVAPAGLVASLEQSDGLMGDARARRAHPHIVGYATAAGAIDAVPVAGLVGVPGVQAKMLHSLARIYGLKWDQRTIGEFAAALGTGTAARALSAFGIRQLVKLIPVYGQTAGAAAAAAASFGMTFALGKAACAFFDQRRSGRVEPGMLAESYKSALADAFRLREERAGAAPSTGTFSA